MRKVRLVLEELQVESFSVESEADGNRGTVKGREGEATVHTNCYTHCATACEGSCTCPSEAPSHCAGDSCSLCPPPDTDMWNSWCETFDICMPDPG